MSPEQALDPSMQSTGGRGGQEGVGTARVVERRVKKSRRDILRLALRNDPVFSAPQHATCDLFAAFVVTELSNSFYLALDNIYSNQFCSLLVLADIAFSVKPKSLLSCM